MDLTTGYRDLNVYESHRAGLHNHTFKGGVPTATPAVAMSVFRLCDISIVAITEHDRRIHTSRDITDGIVPWEDEHWEHEYDNTLLLPGYEASFPDDHVNILGVHYLDVAEEPCTRYGTVYGEPGDAGYVRNLQDRGAFVVLNHPAKWNDEPEHVLEDESLRRIDGIEIYNGNRCTAIDRGLATPLWDACLSAGERYWGLANSDNHRYDFTRTARPTNGWNVVWVSELTQDALFEALEAGRFYATNGLEVDDISVRNETIWIEAVDAKRITFIGDGGSLLEEVAGPSASYAPTGEEGYVRIEVEGDGKPHPDSAVPLQAWLQPIFVD